MIGRRPPNKPLKASNSLTVMPEITVDNNRYYLDLLESKSQSISILQQEQGSIFELLQEREKEFSFNPAIEVVYPDGGGSFLKDPVSWIQKKLVALAREHGKCVGQVTILTTYGDSLKNPLIAAGYAAEKIVMPAGPEHTFKFSKTLPHSDSNLESCQLYLEAVNEQDEKIRPTFVLKMTDEQGVLRGGMCGSVMDVHGQRCAYISTVVVDASVPKSTGTQLARVTLDYLKQAGVQCAHLGTQTASQFYQNLGFVISHRIIDKLRFRVAADGHVVSNDLVIMEKIFVPS